MRVKSNPPKEDPETAARRAVEEARAEADQTAATQGLLARRTKRVLRIFGKPVAGAFGASGSSGASGVVATRTSGARAGGGGRFGGFGGFGGSGGRESRFAERTFEY